MAQRTASRPARQNRVEQAAGNGEQRLSSASGYTVRLSAKKTAFDLSEAMENPFGEDREIFFRGNDYY